MSLLHQEIITNNNYIREYYSPKQIEQFLNRNKLSKKSIKRWKWNIIYILYGIGLVFATLTAVETLSAPTRKVQYSSVDKIATIELLEEPKPVNIPVKTKTLAREVKKPVVPQKGTPQSGRFASTPEELSNIPVNQGSCFDYVPEMAKKYNVNADLMNRIIKAESGGNPLAKNKNSTASGCSQFIRATYASTLRQMGREWTTPFDAKVNVEAMAFKISRGGIGAWNASKHKWSK